MRNGKRKRETGKITSLEFNDLTGVEASAMLLEDETYIAFPSENQSRIQSPQGELASFTALQQPNDYPIKEHINTKEKEKKKHLSRSSFNNNDKDKQESVPHTSGIPLAPTICFPSTSNLENKDENFVPKYQGCHGMDSPSLSSVGTNPEIVSTPYLNLNENKNLDNQCFVSKDPPGTDDFIPFEVGERILLPGGVVSLNLYFTVPLVWTAEKTHAYIERFRRNLSTRNGSVIEDSLSITNHNILNGDMDGERLFGNETEPECQTESETTEPESESELDLRNEAKTKSVQGGVKCHMFRNESRRVKTKCNIEGLSKTPPYQEDEEEKTITVFVREYVLAKHETNLSFPYLLYLQGGPGLASPRISSINSGWMRRALKNFRVLLLDQRGTGKSSPISMQTLSSTVYSPSDQFSILLNYRADSIIRDCEAIRLAYLTRITMLNDSSVKSSTLASMAMCKIRNENLNKEIRVASGTEPRRNSTYVPTNLINDHNFNNVSTKISDFRKDDDRYFYNTQKWTVLGQSYGGFVLLSYLSTYPEGLAACLFTGGLPPLSTENYEEIYRRLYRRVMQQNLKYYTRYPEDAARVRKIVHYLHLRKRIPLPSGGYLTPNRFLQLGTNLGDSTGCEDLHFLIEDAFVEKNCFSPKFQQENLKTTATSNDNSVNNNNRNIMNSTEGKPEKEEKFLAIEKVEAENEDTRKSAKDINEEEEPLELTYKFLRSIEAAQQIYDTSPLYSILHEQIYCHGKNSPPPRWAAHRILTWDPKFRSIFDYEEKLPRYNAKGNMNPFKDLMDKEFAPLPQQIIDTEETNLLHLPVGYKHEHMHKFFYHKNNKRKKNSQNDNEFVDRPASISLKCSSGLDLAEHRKIGQISSYHSASSFDTVNSCDTFCTFNYNCQCTLMKMRNNSTIDASKDATSMNDSLFPGKSPFMKRNNSTNLSTKKEESLSILKNCIFFTAEGTHPWMFDDYIGLQNFRDVANMFSSSKSCTPALYDIEKLKQNKVPCASIIYTSDMYVDSEYSIETASCINNMYTWVCDEYNHAALNEHGYVILDKLLRGIHAHVNVSTTTTANADQTNNNKQIPSNDNFL